MALPLPTALLGGAAIKVVGAMLAKGLLVEVDAARYPDAAVWRESDDNSSRTLVSTAAGMAAIGIEIEAPDSASAGAEKTTCADLALDTPESPSPAFKARTLRVGTKQAALIAMLCAPNGATIAAIATATGWQPHTVRGAMAGALKKTLGLAVTSAKVEGRGRVYRLPAV